MHTGVEESDLTLKIQEETERRRQVQRSLDPTIIAQWQEADAKWKIATACYETDVTSATILTKMYADYSELQNIYLNLSQECAATENLLGENFFQGEARTITTELHDHALLLINSLRETTKDTAQAEIILNAGVIPCLTDLFKTSDMLELKIAIVNLFGEMAFSSARYQAAFTPEVIGLLLKSLQGAPLPFLKTAIWALNNMVCGCEANQNLAGSSSYLPNVLACLNSDDHFVTNMSLQLLGSLISGHPINQRLLMTPPLDCIESLFTILENSGSAPETCQFAIWALVNFPDVLTAQHERLIAANGIALLKQYQEKLDVDFDVGKQEFHFCQTALHHLNPAEPAAKEIPSGKSAVVASPRSAPPKKPIKLKKRKWESFPPDQEQPSVYTPEPLPPPPIATPRFQLSFLKHALATQRPVPPPLTLAPAATGPVYMMPRTPLRFESNNGIITSATTVWAKSPARTKPPTTPAHEASV